MIWSYFLAVVDVPPSIKRRNARRMKSIWAFSLARIAGGSSMRGMKGTHTLIGEYSIQAQLGV
jgi:hypothetical protein